MSSIGNIRQKTNTRFLNFYEFDAIHRDGSVSPYYVASRAREISQLKAVTQVNKLILHLLVMPSTWQI